MPLTPRPHWPSVAVLRSAEISDAERSTTMAVFRLPLNVLVVVVLLLVPLLREEFVFGLAVAMLGVCLVCVLSIQRGAYTTDYEAASVPLKVTRGPCHPVHPAFPISDPPPPSRSSRSTEEGTAR